ncbi:MAG: helix-turn-helix transcriptional regulator [Synechococcaceae cyanobacterium SM2_3_1]|nr:helix-turn-helix transcriptional regulator [Synechococcaceae cyanobacterium SM2_3_1]
MGGRVLCPATCRGWARGNAIDSLLDLARQVGLNDFKLKRGFRAMLGTTVFGYLQTYRMEQVQYLLLDRRLSVAAIAQRVGYVNPSAFWAAFRRHFGTTPKALQR